MLYSIVKFFKALGTCVVALGGLALYFTGSPVIGAFIFIVCLFWWASIFDK